MSADQLVRLITSDLFLLVFIGVARDALRERTKASFDVGLLFALYGSVTVSCEPLPASIVKYPLLRLNCRTVPVNVPEPP